jgi:hypothetical protein
MAATSHKSLEAGPEQLLYADLLQKGMLLGLVLVLITYIIYVTGILQPHIPLGELSKYWSLNVHDYLQQAKIEPGWAWAKMLNRGDFLNFAGIAVLAGVTIMCFLAIVPTLWKNGDKLYAAFSVFEALILAVAASGILGSAGH